MTRPEYRYGKPFDLLLLCGSQTESGRSLHDIGEVAPVVAQAVLVLSDTPLRDAAAGVTNNVFRRLEELSPDGEPTAWGSLGIVNWTFSGRLVALYFAHDCARALIDSWRRRPSAEEVQPRLNAAGHSSHMSDLDELMRFVQEENGRPRLGDFGKEAVRALKGAKVKAKALPDRLRTFEETFDVRVRRALRDASRASVSAAESFALALEREARAIVDGIGPAAGHTLAEEALNRLAAIQATLEGQRDAMRERLADAESEAARSLQALEAACVRSRFGWLRPIKKHLAAYLSSAALAFRLRYAFDLTQGVLAALSGCGRNLAQLRLSLATTLDSFELVHDRCVRWAQEFESQESSPVAEIIRRPLYSIDQLHRLYQRTYGSPWGVIPDSVESAIRQKIAGISRWIGLGPEQIYVELMEAGEPAFQPTAEMTADGFVRWLSAEGDTSPALLVRDSEELAPALCRYDRARLPDSGAFEDTAFRILGVPDRDDSVFNGVGDALLVSTGDPDHLVYVSLKLGLPSSALWHNERFARASEEIRRGGRVALRIYPGLSDGDPAVNGGARGRMARPTRNAAARNGSR